jgi:hypothetical protein
MAIGRHTFTRHRPRSATRLGSRFAGRRLSTGGTEGNEILTISIAGILTALLAVEGYTVLDVRGRLALHMFIGLVIIPPLLVKLASTTYRMARYYVGTGGYREKGPPRLHLRLLAPVLVAATISLFGSGVALMLSGHRSGLLLTVHQGSFIVWGAVFAVHFLSYAPRLLQSLRRNWSSSGRLHVPGASLRAMLAASALGSGVALALLALPTIAAWHGQHGRF